MNQISSMSLIQLTCTENNSRIDKSKFFIKSLSLVFVTVNISIHVSFGMSTSKVMHVFILQSEFGDIGDEWPCGVN